MNNEQLVLFTTYALAGGLTDIDEAFAFTYRLWDEDHRQTHEPQLFAKRVFTEARRVSVG